MSATMLFSNIVVFNWSNDPNIGWQNVARLCCVKIDSKSNFTIHRTTSSNILHHAIWGVVKRTQHWLPTILHCIARECESVWPRLYVHFGSWPKRFHSSCKLTSSAKVNVIKISKKRYRKKDQSSPVQRSSPSFVLCRILFGNVWSKVFWLGKIKTILKAWMPWCYTTVLHQVMWMVISLHICAMFLSSIAFSFACSKVKVAKKIYFLLFNARKMQHAVLCVFLVNILSKPSITVPRWQSLA